MDKADKYDDMGRNVLDSAEDAYQRAKILLEAHHELADTFHHPADVPKYAIERLITDLMHYAHQRNKGKTVDGGEVIDFDRAVSDARQQFIKEREAAPELHEPLLDPNRPKPDPEFEKMQNELYSRQLAELKALDRKQQEEAQRLGPSKQIDLQHLQERRNLAEEHEKERERYVREYHEAKALARELEQQQEKDKALEPGGLDFGKK